MRADGYRAVAVADGDAAIALAARADARPDIVIVDINLPRGLTGLQVMARLRELIGHDLPALVLTGDISTETLSEIARQGYVHRSKPIKRRGADAPDRIPAHQEAVTSTATLWFCAGGHAPLARLSTENGFRVILPVLSRRWRCTNRD